MRERREAVVGKCIFGLEYVDSVCFSKERSVGVEIGGRGAGVGSDLECFEREDERSRCKSESSALYAKVLTMLCTTLRSSSRASPPSPM